MSSFIRFFNIFNEVILNLSNCNFKKFKTVEVVSNININFTVLKPELALKYHKDTNFIVFLRLFYIFSSKKSY